MLPFQCNKDEDWEVQQKHELRQKHTQQQKKVQQRRKQARQNVNDSWCSSRPL
jgi:hypothetical protein